MGKRIRFKRKDLEVHKYDPQDREGWLELRRQISGFGIGPPYRIGGSDIGTVVGVNPWSYAGQLWYQYLGVWDKNFTENQNTHWGHQLEPLIADAWQYYEEDLSDDPFHYVRNKQHENIIRRSYEYHATVVNKNIPNLYGNVDRLFWQPVNSRNTLAILECKFIHGLTSKDYIGNLPPYQIYQIQQYEAVFGATYGEIVHLVDGSNLKVFPMPANKKLQKQIFAAAQDFIDRLEAGYDILQQGYDVDTTMAELSMIEPAPDDTDACKLFMTERAKKFIDQPPQDGDPEDEHNVERLLYFRNAEKRGKRLKNYYENLIKGSMVKKETLKLEFGTRGYVTMGSNGALYPTLKEI